MRLKNKIFLVFVLVFASILAVQTSAAAQSNSEEPGVVITFFWREGCSHCAAEKPYLQELISQNPQIDLRAYEVYSNTFNLDYLLALGEAQGFETGGVPVTVIGDQAWVGYSDAIAAEISSAVTACSVSGCGDPAEKFGLDTSGTVNSLEVSQESDSNSSITWWAVGSVAVVLAAYSLGSWMRKRGKKTSSKRH